MKVQKEIHEVLWKISRNNQSYSCYFIFKNLIQLNSLTQNLVSIGPSNQFFCFHFFFTSSRFLSLMRKSDIEFQKEYFYKNEHLSLDIARTLENKLLDFFFQGFEVYIQ